jgi:hypothetical protein
VFYLKEMKRKGYDSGLEPQSKIVRFPSRPLNGADATSKSSTVVSLPPMQSIASDASTVMLPSLLLLPSLPSRPLNGADATSKSSTVVRLPLMASNGADSVSKSSTVVRLPLMASNGADASTVRLPSLPSRPLNGADATSKSSTVVRLPLMASKNGADSVSKASTVVSLPPMQSIASDANTFNKVAVSTNVPHDIRSGISPPLPPLPQMRGSGALRVLIPSPPPPPPLRGCLFQRRSPSPQMMSAGGGRVNSVSPNPFNGRSCTPTPPGRTGKRSRDLYIIYTHVWNLFNGKFPQYFKSLKTPIKTKQFIETLTALLLSASLNEGNPTRFHTHPVLVYCMFMRLAEMYETLRFESTPLANILNLIDTAFTHVISGDPLSVWDRMMTIVTELNVQSDCVLNLISFLVDESMETVITGHMTALIRFCKQLRLQDSLQTFRASFYWKVSKLNSQHGIPFLTISSTLTRDEFCQYFQSLGLGNLALEYYEVFVACFHADSSTTSP